MTPWYRPGDSIAGSALLAVLLAVGLTGCAEGDIGLGTPGSAGDRPADRPGERAVAQARDDLAELRIGTQRSSPSYDRDAFGVRWKDIDRNGCDQRNDVLDRDLDDTVKRGGCVVLEGVLDDPYTGKEINFSKSRDAAEVQIDHVYPLALAWRMGASGWSEDRRERFANDPANLLAVWGVPNRQKSDSGPADWKPQRAYQCAYGVKYIAVSAEYDLPVTRTDASALKEFLDRC